jgi:hypothetical protein
MLSSGAYVIIWDKMLSSGADVIMVSSGANVIIWCYHVMLLSGMITHPFFNFPENFTHSCTWAREGKYVMGKGERGLANFERKEWIARK